MPKARKLPSGSWRAEVYTGIGQDGKRKYKSFTADTRREAEYLAAEYAAKRKRNAKQEKDRTLSEAYARYVEIKSNTISPSTVVEYRHAAGRDFPSLMPLRLSQITQEAVQSAVNIMSADHSPKSVKNAHGLLSAVLKMFAPDIRLTTRLPQSKRPEIHVPTNDEIERLVLSIRGTELEKAVLLAAFGSLRRSECCALTVDDLTADTVTVNKAMVHALSGGWTIKQPKSRAGYRTLQMPRFVMERLTPRQGTSRIVDLAPVTVTEYFRKALQKYGLPHFRFHDLRHYQASILHAMGVPDKYIMERGGWRTDSTLKNIYQHTMDAKRAEVEQKICGLFDGSSLAQKIDESPSE